MAAQMDEEAIIRKRYLTQTVATAANTVPPFKRLVKKYMRFCQVLQGGSLEEVEKLHTELLADLYAIQFHMAKLAAQGGAYERERRAYAERQEQLQASIQQAERDIEDRKRELGEARVELAHKQEYETLKKQVMQVPARSATLAEQEGTRREIADLASQSADLDMLFEQRKAQFAGVLAALEQLQRSIDKDEPEESVVVLPDQQGGGGGCGAAAGGKPAAGAQVAQQQQRQAMQAVGRSARKFLDEGTPGHARQPPPGRAEVAESTFPFLAKQQPVPANTMGSCFSKRVLQHSTHRLDPNDPQVVEMLAKYESGKQGTPAQAAVAQAAGGRQPVTAAAAGEAAATSEITAAAKT